MPVDIEQHGDVIDVTFAHHPEEGDGAVLMVATFSPGGLAERLLPRGADGIATRTWRLPADFLGTYLFWVAREGADLPEDAEALLPVMYSDAGRPMPDPGNPDRFEYPIDPERPGPQFVQSILRGPAAVAEPYLGAPLLGRLTEHRLASAQMGDERRVWVHESIGCDGADSPPALMVVFDGGIYAHLLHTPEQVDALVAEGVMPPTVTLYCHYASEPARHAELMCRPDFAEFVAAELVPWAAERWRFTDDPARTIIGGSSLGGLGAAWLALQHPERFGNVIAQSPSFWWHPDHPNAANWMAERWAVAGPPDVRVYAEMGSYERTPGPDGRSAYDHTVDFVEVARRRGNEAVFEPFTGGHDYLVWRATFSRALRWIAAGLAQ